ncbi:MAG: M20 family metallopeptidase, partial [Candidatus Aminicenantales bacterium]
RDFKKLGDKVTDFSQEKIGNIYLLEYPGQKRLQPPEQILILTHLDTVWPVGKIKKMPFYVSGQKVFGPGVLDMKAGVAMAILSLRALHQLNVKPKKKITVFLNSAEEIQSQASEKLIKDLARKSSCVLCLEPALPGGAVKMERKGRLVIRLEAKGKAAHAGNPELGLNAIEELVNQIQKLKRLRTNQITVNIGLIGGGEKANIVAANAWTILDIRFWRNKQKEKILNTIRQLKSTIPGTKLNFTLESLTPPMEKTRASSQLFNQIKNIASSLNISLEAGKSGGGSDASFASNLGIPTVDGLGPEGEEIHADNENLLLPSLLQRTALLTELLQRL